MPKAFAAKLLNLGQLLTFGYSLQSAQLLIPETTLHLRTLHHIAFSFRAHPGQLPFLKLEQDPQYNPQ